MKESREKVIKLPDKDIPSFRCLLDYFYTGCVTLNKSVICQLIELCDYYNVQKLKQECCNWLCRNLRVEDVCQYLVFAGCADEQLHKDCLDWLDDHISEVTKTAGFTQLLTEEQLEKILARDSLNIHEIDLFESLERWVKYDPDGRQKVGNSVAKQIRLPTMTSTQLLGTVQCSGLVDMAEIVKAVTLLQQPGSTNLYEEGSPAIVLRLPKIPKLPSDHLKWSISQVRKDNSGSRGISVEFPKMNLATIKATGESDGAIVLHTTEIKVPYSMRVQVFANSSQSYRTIHVGIEINKRPRGRRHYTEQGQQGYYISGAEVTSSVVTLGDSGVSVPVGCAIYFSLHITGASLCTQVNGAISAKTSLDTALEHALVKSTCTLLVEIINPTERMTIAIQEDTSPCCKK